METGKVAPDARALTRIRILCMLGLESHAIMPALLKEMHGLIRSRTNAFVWGDQRRRVESYLSESPDHALPRAAIYRDETLNHLKRVVIAKAMLLLRVRRQVPSGVTGAQHERRIGCEHGYHGRIARPPECDHALRVAVDHYGSTLGAISLRRAANDPCFETRDVIRLAAIKPYLARALTVARAELEAPLVDSTDQGLAIVDVTGGIQHMSREARRLLLLASHPGICSEHLEAPARIVLPREVMQLCRGLAHEFERQGRDIAPQVWRCRNCWGGFVFRVYWLKDYFSGYRPLIGLAIQRQEPLPLKIFRHLEQLPLSVRQMQVCLLLAAGHSRRSIAARLGVTEHTAVTYVRQVYGRLQVHTRGELWQKLLLL